MNDEDRQADWLTKKLEDREYRIEFDKERAAQEFAMQLDRAMSNRGMTRSQLAAQLGRSRPFVTQCLTRGQNLTIKTMVELAAACGHEFHVVLHEHSPDAGPMYLEPIARTETVEMTTTVVCLRHTLKYQRTWPGQEDTPRPATAPMELPTHSDEVPWWPLPRMEARR